MRRSLRWASTARPTPRVAAARMLQKSDDLSVRLEQMKLTYRTEADQEWTLTAASGFVPPGSAPYRSCRRRGGQRSAAARQRARGIAHRAVALDTQASIATNDRVDILWGNRRLSSMGLKADLKGQKLQLESSVHGRFVR